MSLQQAAKGRDVPGWVASARNDGTLQPSDDWYDVSRCYQENARLITGRFGLGVTVVPLGDDGSFPPGMADLLTDSIVLNGSLIPGGIEGIRAKSGEALKALAVVEGVFRHEIGHIDHTTPYVAEGITPEVRDAVALLEEIRMEARVAEQHPDAIQWIRAAANSIIVEEVTSAVEAGKCGSGAAAARTAVLTLGRVHAGTLEAGDVSTIAGAVNAILGTDALATLDALCAEVTTIPDMDLDALFDAARRYLELVPPDEQPSGGDGGEGLAATLSEALDGAAGKAVKALKESGQLAAKQQEIAEAAAKGQAPKATDPTPQEAGEAPDKDELRQNALRAVGIGSASGVLVKVSTRTPSPSEAANRRRMIAMFREARFRERDVEIRNRPTPPGRLRVRGVVQREALRSAGVVAASGDLFEQRRIRHVDEPVLAVGICLDLSGSMKGKEPVLAAAAYAVSEGVRFAAGDCSVATFGDAFGPLAGPGLRLGGVPKIMADGGTEYLPEALDYIAGASMLYTPRHVRMAIVISDGAWQQPKEVDRRMRSLEAAGCTVAVVDVGSAPRASAASVHLAVKDVNDLARALGGLFSAAYRERAAA